MAKKIIFSYGSNPLSGEGLQYKITINNIDVTYNNALNEVNVNYLSLGNPNVPPYGIELKSTLSETLDNTLNFINANYIYSAISYEWINDTLEVLINADNVIVTVYASGVNSVITYEIVDVDTTIQDINLRYYFQYKNIVNDDYLCKIYNRNFTGTAQEIRGKATIEKGSIKEHLDTIRGTGLSIELEASTDINLSDLYTQDEQDFTVRFYKNNKLIFSGFLKPDGIFQSFTRDNWIITMDCVDGLGGLSNLSFVNTDGFHFVGKMKAIDIIYNCLNRIGIKLKINTSINTYYEGLTPSDTLDILTKIQMNTDRFVKIDDSTIMSCEEVLKSVLDIFCACITQNEGEWYIFKPNEVYQNNGYVKFRRYDENGVYIGVVTKNLNKKIGSQIDNYYPHHCNGDQRIQIKGGISAFRLGYKYGYISSFLENPNLLHDAFLNYEGWTILDTFPFINDPLSSSGFLFKNLTSGNTNLWCISDILPVIESDLLTLKLSWEVNRQFFTSSSLKMKINVGSYYLKYTPQNDQTPFEDAIQNSVWTTNSADTWTINLEKTGSFEFPIPAIPVDGNITFGIQSMYPSGGTTLIKTFDVIPNTGLKAEIGEFHTISRRNKISTLIKENKTVYNGDNVGIIYLGAIFKDNGLDTTSLWFRRNFNESFPLLRIAAEDELRISQKPIQMFNGSIYGFIDYLSLIEINNLNGKSMPIEYSYDTYRNVTKVKLLELYCAEIQDIIYKFTLDYGNTVKPTITS